MTKSLTLRITELEAELAEYRAAFEALIKTKVELAAAVEGQPTREQLVIEVAHLREALWWCITLGDFHLSKYRAHVLEMLAVPS